MRTVDVAVVGAGFAGLTAATELQREGLDVVVLEARDRVGGKTDSQVDELGRPVDTGGQFVCDDMAHVLRLIEQQGRHLVRVDHDRPGQGFPAGWSVFEQAERAYSGLWDLEGVPDPAASLGSWFASRGLPADALHAARSTFGGVMCMSVDRVPLFHAVDLARRTPLTRDELQYVVAETIHGVAVELAASLDVHLDTPVRSIEVGPDEVVVRADGFHGRARHVIVAVPPTALASISFAPPLPGYVTDAATAFEPGSVMKFLVRYERPFWRRDDVGATAVWADPAGFYVGEASLDDDTPMLVAFLGGPASEAWRSLPAADRRATVIERLVEAYGPQAAHPVSFVERDWPADEWGGGGYWNVLVDHDQPDAVEVLRTGVPGITFASTELAPSFPGYIEGAITAGAAAAERVLASRR